MNHKIKNFFEETKKTFELSFSLAKADFKLRNAGSYLGIFWYLLSPLSLFLIILLIKKGSALSSSNIELYPIYLLVGVVLYNFFSKTLSWSVNTINSNSGLIKSMKIKYAALVISKVIEGTFSHFFEILLLIIFMAFFDVPLIGIVYYFAVFVFLFVCTLGLSFIFSTIGTYINDFSNVWSIATHLLFFLTPIFHSVEKRSVLHDVNLFNPLYYFVTAARDVIIYNKIPDLYISVGIMSFSFAFLIIGVIVFNKFKPKFAESV